MTKYLEYRGGEVSRYTTENGQSWRRESDGWYLYDSKGERTTVQLQGDIDVDSQGNFTFIHRDGTRETTRADGTVERTPPPRR